MGKNNKKEEKIKTREIVKCKKFKLQPQACPDNSQWVKRVLEYFDRQIDLKNEIFKNYSEWLSKEQKTYETLVSELEKLKIEMGVDSDTDLKDAPDEIQKVSKKIKDSVNKQNKYEKKIDEANADIVKISKNKSIFSSIVINYENSPQKDRDFVNEIAKKYTYDLIRRSCRSEARRKNTTLSYVYFKCLEEGIDNIQDLKEKNSAINDIVRYCTRVKSKPNAKKSDGSLLDIVDIDNPLGGYGFSYSQALSAKIKELIKNGLLEGRVSLDCYKEDTPVSIAAAHISLIPNFDLIGTSDKWDLKRIMKDESSKIFVNIGNKGQPSIARFSLIVGSKQKNKAEPYNALYQLLTDEYRLGGSSIQIGKLDKNDKADSIILNLSLKKTVLVTNEGLDENIVMGVDLGVNTPALCAFSNSRTKRYHFGSKKEILKTKNQIKAEQDRYKKQIHLYKYGGKSKNKIMEAKRRITQKANNWERTYNHIISRNIVNLALRKNAKYINLEDFGDKSPKKESETERAFGFWSYYQLQNYIKYKAEEHGIIVRFVDPKNTSITCSHCGNTDKEQRNGETFICNNPHCSHHDEEVNADFNAARNIALSTNFVKK